ncbi:ADP-ribosylation [Karstenula rhodostoma CBS 690.94]|uniref:ADP-ribosylation n=1 Tax=Karstenula rhodostoma CBS 690.94 TaxID=1392251 RepID=A0A9P4PKM4_9PLEO|nr:ADP-ribosylation [Karstenula rhodostoma CBS 690.94]
MFWKTSLLLFGVLGAISNAVPVFPFEGEETSLEAVPQNFTIDGSDGHSLDKRFVVTHVFRADKRSPAQLAKSDGFLPKGYTSKTAVKEDVSLFRHVIGAASGFSMDNDGYVSTTSSRAVAEGWITKFLGGSGYTYKIATYANLIDVQETLKHYNKYPQEKEFAALMVIPWDQVMGWSQFSVTKNGVVKGTPTANPQYNAARNEDPWYFYTQCRPAARSAEEIFARDAEPITNAYAEEIDSANIEESVDADTEAMADADVEEIAERDTEEIAMTEAEELVARGKVRTSRPKSSKKKTSATRKHKTAKKPKKTASQTGTKCTAAMAKAGKCKTTCTAAMKKAGKCGTVKCSAKDEKAGKCCSAASKKAGKCKQHDCGPIKTNKQAAQEYLRQIQMGTTPPSGSHPKSAGKKGTKVRNKSGKRIGS